ncbi:MAG: hypothetical protein QOH55_76, partial [Microbacteriaceae bacterium]|nr:hypothetical protein [Microbacteriaceae bacterium]
EGGAGVQNAADLRQCAKRCQKRLVIELLDDLDIGWDRVGRRPHRIK